MPFVNNITPRLNERMSLIEESAESRYNHFQQARYEAWCAQRMRLHPTLRTTPRTGLLRALEEGVSVGQEMLDTDRRLRLYEQHLFLFYVSRPAIDVIKNAVVSGRNVLGFFSANERQAPSQSELKAPVDHSYYRRPGI